MDDQTHTYNLKAVVMETGLKPVTLRAWERRYGLPDPVRTSGGHRLYSQRDIDMLKWMVDRQEEGVSISQAVSLWRQIEEDGDDPLRTYVAATEGGPSPRTVAPLPNLGEQIGDLRQAWIDACMNFDESSADYVLTQAFARFPAEVVCAELLQRGINEIGMGWYAGRVSVQQEHFASSQAMRRLDMLIAAQSAPIYKERVLVACAPHDTHTLSTSFLTFFLRRQGWDVVYLGADVPVQRMDETLAKTHPQLVVFTAQELHTAAHLLPIAYLLEQKQIPFAFGGLAFNWAPQIRPFFPGHFLGEKFPDAVETVRHLLTTTGSRLKPAQQQASAHYQAAQQAYKQQRSAIEAALWHTFARLNLPENMLVEVNTYFSRDIQAALVFNDIALLDINMGWLQTLLKNHEWEQSWLTYYMQEYERACQAHLAADHPLRLWLANYLAQMEPVTDWRKMSAA
jgi:methanogenic corrinoid protein MtbC1